jgi:nicotinate-nucleotide pyrophosphorylase
VDPLTAIAAFNASYAVVKTAAQNAGEISEIFAGIGKMMTAKKAVEEASSSSPEKSDLELYAAKVELDQKWAEVKEILHWTGHWSAYEKFVQDRREQEKQAKIAATRKKMQKQKMHQDIAIIIGGSLAALAVIAAFIVAISAAKG